jgi:hypothetical protein
MTTVQDCLQEIIAKGTKYFISSTVSAAAGGNPEWAATALYANMQQESPGLLSHHAWTEWATLPDGSSVCYIHYGVFGFSLSHADVPGYGSLRALELSHSQRASNRTFLLT